MGTIFVDFENGSDSKGNALTDYSTSAKTITLVGSADITGNASKWGTSSLDLTETTSTSSAAQVANSADFQFGAGQFTVECFGRWADVSGASAESLLSLYDSSNISWNLNRTSTNLSFTYSTNGTATSSLNGLHGGITAGTYYHIAADRDASNVLRIYLNGVVVASSTVSASFYASTTTLRIGNTAFSGQRFPGNISEARITKGIARYAGAFTPPTAAFPANSTDDPNWSSVVLLARFDGAKTGLTFADRLKTLPGPAKIAPGDEVRIMASPDPTLIGNATWNQYSKTITLAAAVTQNIDTCDSGWTTGGAGRATVASTSTCKQGTNATIATPVASYAVGKAIYHATGTLDLSAFQQVSFWIKNISVALPDGAASLRLCSDTTGDVSVHTIPIPALPSTAQFVPVTVDLGGALNSAIQSVALYYDATGLTGGLHIDNILACKAPSAADSLTLTSLIGKVHNLSWAASTAYSLNDKRRPTQPNRNGFQYQVTTAGTTGSSEPTWPAYWGGTVTDGSVVWTGIQNELEDTWYGIQSINGTTVLLDSGVNTTASSGRGYHGATETVATYKRETIKQGMVASSSTAINTIQDSGTAASPLIFSGGWDRTSMVSQSGETWVDGQNGFGAMFSMGQSFINAINLNAMRCQFGWTGFGASIFNIKSCHSVVITGVTFNFGGANVMLIGCNASNTVSNPLSSTNASLTIKASSFNSNSGIGLNPSSADYSSINVFKDIIVKNNNSYGVQGFGVCTLQNLVTGNNAGGGVSFPYGNATLVNSLLPEVAAISATNVLMDRYIYSHNHNQTAGSHLITTDGGTIKSDATQRHTTSGISWKFNPTSANRGSLYPLKLSVAKIACLANTPVNLTIWTRRDNANIKGQLFVAGGQLAGVPYDVTVACEPTINTWVQSSTLSFTPTETGVVEVLYKCWDGVGTTNSLWIDDLGIA